MEIGLLEELRKQKKLSKFFSYWQNKENVQYPGEKEMLLDLEKMSQNLAMKEGIILGCFDYRDLSLAFFTENIEEISGHSAEFLKNNGIAGVISALHPEDAIEHVEFNNRVLDAFNAMSLSEKRTLELSYTLRWLHKVTKNEIWFFTKAKPYLINDNGDFIYDLHIGFQITNHEHLTGYDWSFSYIKDDGTKILFKKTREKSLEIPFTKKEKEVAKWIVEGLNTKEIAEKMFISQNTVFTHRKRLLKKLNAKSTAEMFKILASLKID
jgi:RNA polymerase sigma factor (sigma-70 family)